MIEPQIELAFAELKRSSRLSVVMVVIGAVFLVGSLYYAATRLSPLEDEIARKKQEIAALEAKKIELQRVTETVTQMAKPISTTATNVDGWLYVGRIGGTGTWAPPSEGITPTPDSLQTSDFKNVSVIKDAPIVSNIDTPKGQALEPNSMSAEPVQFVRSGTQLAVIGVERQPSIGGGMLVWVKVTVPPERVLQVGAK